MPMEDSLRSLTRRAALLALALGLVPGVALAQDGPRLGWVELLTEDSRAAAQFYAGLFGWAIEGHSDGKYRLRLNGELVGGITQIENRDGEDHTTWLLGVTVPAVRDAVVATRDNGGRVIRDQSRTADGGEWAVIEDGQGAELLVYTGGLRIEGDPAPGRWAWAELWTTEPDAARDFYGAVVGWDLEEVEHPDGTYLSFTHDGDLRAGVVPITGERVDPGWAPYIGVTDVAATVARAEELGGEVLLAPGADVYGGRVAILRDPTGVGFLVFELEEGAE